MAATWLAGIPLTTGVGYAGLSIVGAAGLLLLLGRRRLPARSLTVLAAGSMVVVAAVGLLVNDVLHPFPEAVPQLVLVAAGLGLFGLGLGAMRAAASVRWRRRVGFVLAGVLVAATSANAVNAEFGYLPTVGALLGLDPANTIELPKYPLLASPPVRARPGAALEQTWSPPPDLPSVGRVVEPTSIPGTASGFDARPAWIYLPPAYLVGTPPALPVLVLISGQPGTPRDWIDAGHVVATLDAFAAEHHGLAPIVVMPDALGATTANPMCLDSRLGDVETYLARDVPDWVNRTFVVDPNPAAWVIGGFSYGGTCALQLAVRAPDVYRSFINIAGQKEPTLGSRERTVEAAYGGNDDKFTQVNPLDVMARQRFPGTGGYFVVGRDDTDVNKDLRQVDEAAIGSGMNTSWIELPGRHSWDVAAQALTGALPWVAVRTGLIAP
jgi:S-formylglutathione hydrolase FrmB